MSLPEIENKLADALTRVKQLEANFAVMETRLFVLQLTIAFIVLAAAVLMVVIPRRAQRRLRETAHTRTRVDMSDLPHG